MVRWSLAIFVIALGSSAEAMPRVPLQLPDQVVTMAREACGAGMHRVNGVCVTTHARRAARRCAAGMTC
jgi:hypothetical protein